MECKLDNITIYYEIIGEGFPVLMLHGWPVDHRLMKGCMEPIFESRPNYKRIYFDLPGMGKTKAEEWIEDTDDFITIIMEFLKTIIPNKQFIIVSESYGCYLALGLISKIQNLIDGVLFLVPIIVPYNDKRNLPEILTLIKDDNLISTLTPLEKQFLEDLATVITPKIGKRGIEEAMSGVLIADMEFLDRVHKNYAFSFDAELKKIHFTKPTLFLLGRQDSAVGYQDAWEIIENYPRATFAILDTAGHLLQIEQEELFNALTNEWLDRVEYNLKID